MEIFKTNKEKNPRVLLDMDGMIFYFIKSIIEYYNTNYKIENCSKWELKEMFDEEILLKNSDKSIKEIVESNRYDIFLVTACNTSAYLDKVEWVKEFMPYFNTKHIIPTSGKNAVWANVLVDDNIYNVKEFNELIGTGIIYDMPHNRNTEEYKRIYNLGELLPILDKMFYPELNK